MVRLLALALIVAWIAGTTSSLYAENPDQATGSVSGKIVDIAGTPVSGAAVAVQLGLTARFLGKTTSGPDGTFTIANVPVGTFTLVAARDRIHCSKKIKIKADQNTEVGNLTLEPQKTTCAVAIR